MQYVIGKVQRRDFGKTRDRAPAPQAGRRILVVGVGGAGCAAVEWVREDCPGAATLAVNTDRISLEFHQCDTKVLLGESLFHGRGALGHAEAAERAATDARDQMASRLTGYDVVAILTSLGGGTGAGVAPVMAAQAREAGAAVIAVVTIPFRAERSRRARALKALSLLRERAHTTILIDSEALLPVAGHLPINQALALLDYFMAEVPRSLLRVEREARPLVLAGGLGTLSYHEWEAGESEAPTPLVMMAHAGAPATLSLLHVDAHSGHGPQAAGRLAARMAKALSAKHDPQSVHVTVRHDPEMTGGGRALALLTGIESFVGHEPAAPDVTLQPTGIFAAVTAPPASEAPNPANGDPAKEPPAGGPLPTP